MCTGRADFMTKVELPQRHQVEAFFRRAKESGMPIEDVDRVTAEIHAMKPSISDLSAIVLAGLSNETDEQWIEAARYVLTAMAH